jgi:hypothetical protein
METDQNGLAARYLLGKLSDEEQANVEKEYFHDPSSFEDILIAENSLIDAYVSDRLSPEDRLLFEKRLLISPRQRQRARFAETLVSYASRQPIEESVSPTSQPLWLTRFVSSFSFRPLLSYSLAAAALLISATGIFWFASHAPARLDIEDLAHIQTPAAIERDKSLPAQQTEEPRSAITKENQTVLKDEAIGHQPTAKSSQLLPKPELARRAISPAIVSTIILSLGSTRDAGAGKVFVLPEKTGFVNLKLQFECRPFSSYFAVVETADGQQVWKGRVSGSSMINNGKTASLTVPAQRLGRGDYIVSLKGLTKAGLYESVADYSFTVDRR